MFERYTEKGRRVIFFARYEASQFGSPFIETEHLLLGLFREDKALTNRFLHSRSSIESIRRQIEERTPPGEKTPTSIDLPLTDECKRVLAYAAEEADRLAHRHIGTEHLLLGMLREKKSFAASLLTACGVTAEVVREALTQQPNESSANIPDNRSFGAATARAFQRPLPPPGPALGAKKKSLLRSIRLYLSIVILGLLLSGITAFPLQHELSLLVRLSIHAPSLNLWLLRVHTALADTNSRYPFLAYGTDWLAFAHLVIAAAFIGPWLDPVRNKWLITWALIACAGVLPLALIAGPLRGIPLYWRLIDCSFGLVCCLPLLLLRRRIDQLERLTF